MLKAVTKRFSDHSTMKRFEFVFYCDCCGAALPPVVSLPAEERSSADGREEQALRYAANHAEAFARANEEAGRSLHRCPVCGGMVCAACVKQGGLCESCVAAGGAGV